ncbi:hypothetical protein JOD57_002369 [Geodermatophilus bullaregiensis]|uniref:13E12 repeat family protein n=1 Tax=Geodermatophilus bullaregiensis TaxID=1564160 RepID=UPI001EF8D082|nr:13E12 repeat family protein [Geodermatophilus bullaregiensis]MBM7806532.1 hypothetical protein [Geodermatophilus bullaregiensis]
MRSPGGWSSGLRRSAGCRSGCCRGSRRPRSCHGTAAHLAHRAWLYRSHLPATWAALAAGELDEARAKVLVDVLAHTSAGVARGIEAQLLPEAADRTTGRLRQRALGLLLQADADAVDARRAQAQRPADVRCYPSPLDGMATLAAELPAGTAAACHDTLDRLARMLKADGDHRPVGQLRTAVLADLIQRPWDTGHPAVTAHLQITATLAALAGASAEAGDVNGLAITAAQVRELLAQFDALNLCTAEGGTTTIGITDEAGVLLATAGLDRLRRLARRSCPDHPATDCGCPVLDRPEPVDTYEPSAAQQTFLHTRDRTCRFPPAGSGSAGPTPTTSSRTPAAATDCADLCCLCRSHHRLETHARGWRFQMDADGVLTVTTPSGITRTTRPPGLRPPPAVDTGPPPQPDPPVRRTTTRHPSDRRRPESTCPQVHVGGATPSGPAPCRSPA